MKAYTYINQSKKLAEILPLDSADMFYVYDRHLDKLYGDTPYVIGYKVLNENVDIPCWSLAALLEAIPKCIGDYNIFRMDINDIDTSMWYDKIGYGVCNELPDITIKEPVDACVAMIEKLHEQKLL